MHSHVSGEMRSGVRGLDTFFTGRWPFDQMANWRTRIASERTERHEIPGMWDLSDPH